MVLLDLNKIDFGQLQCKGKCLTKKEVSKQFRIGLISHTPPYERWKDASEQDGQINAATGKRK